MSFRFLRFYPRKTTSIDRRANIVRYNLEGKKSNSFHAWLIRLKSFENPALELISHPVVVSNLDEARVFSRPDRLTVARVTLPATIGHWIMYYQRIEREKDIYA